MHIKFRRGKDKGKRILDLSHLCCQIDWLHSTWSKSSLIKFLCTTKIACVFVKTLFSYRNISATVRLKLCTIFCEDVLVSLYKTKHVINISKQLQAVPNISFATTKPKWLSAFWPFSPSRWTLERFDLVPDLQTIWMSSSTGATAWNEKDYIHIRKSTETDQVPSHQETGSEFLDEEIELFMWRIKLRELHEN